MAARQIRVDATIAPDIAIVLPPREAFSRHGAGAIALLVHRLTAAPSRYRRIVFGSPCEDPFSDVDFRPVTPRLVFGRHGRRYAHGVARALGAPALIEVHNRAEVALHLAALRPQAKVTLFLHNDPPGIRGLRTAAQRAAMLDTLAGIVCVSRYLADRLAPADPRVTVLPNCIDLAALPPPAARRDPVILFAGRMVADKGADAFVEACRIALPTLPGWRAEMIGADRPGPASPVTPFLVQLRAQALRVGVTLRGYLPHDEVMAAMARAAIVVVPSRWPEPFGLTALEAMASGAALICSNRGGLAEVTGDVAVPCDPDNPATLAEAMKILAATPPSPAGRARAAQFDTRHAAAALDHTRARLLSSPERPLQDPP